jgi:hypothetical protein
MRNLFFVGQFALIGLVLMSSMAFAASSSPPPSFSSKPQLKSPEPKKEEPPPPHKPLVKPELPLMLKPFLMPGVIGLQMGKWEGSDYLGYLSNNIGVSVEVVKGADLPQISDNAAFEASVSEAFKKEGIIPRADVKEGPPLPFFHILILIYPTDKDRYVIVANGRLFEHIQVVRNEFIPAGFWQGITWEIQDIATAGGQELNAKIKEMAEKLATSFAKRYRQYNSNSQGLPESNFSAPPSPQE